MVPTGPRRCGSRPPDWKRPRPATPPAGKPYWTPVSASSSLICPSGLAPRLVAASRIEGPTVAQLMDQAALVEAAAALVGGLPDPATPLGARLEAVPPWLAQLPAALAQAGLTDQAARRHGHGRDVVDHLGSVSGCRGGPARQGAALPARRPGRAQCPLPVRQRQEVQVLPRPLMPPPPRPPAARRRQPAASCGHGASRWRRPPATRRRERSGAARRPGGTRSGCRSGSPDWECRRR